MFPVLKIRGKNVILMIFMCALMQSSICIAYEIQVYRAQRKLNQLGYDAGPLDGIHGGKTSTALRHYQKDHSLKETGRLDRSTLRSLGIYSGNRVLNGLRLICKAYTKQYGTQRHRKISFDVKDWPGITDFVRINYDTIPILGKPDLKSKRLTIVGIAISGEILQFVEKRKQMFLENPLDRRPSNSGAWIKVRLLEGNEGWIFAKPTTLKNDSIADYFKKAPKVISKPNKNHDIKSKDYESYGVIIIIFVVLIYIMTKIFKGPKQVGSSYSSSSYDSNITPATESERDQNVFLKTAKIEKAIFSDDKILRDSSGGKIGRIEKAIFSDDQIIRDGGGKKAGRIEKSIWDSDKQIIKGADGKKEGEIKTNFWGDRVIVDKSGKKIGKIEKNIWGETVIKKK